MDNFLNTLRDWGESLFNGKGAWASAQAFPEKQTRIIINYTPEGSYICPYDGYVGFYTTNSTFVDIYSYQILSQGIQTRWHFNSNPTQFSSAGGTICAKKGATIKWNFSSPPTELWFIPSTGSQ